MRGSAAQRPRPGPRRSARSGRLGSFCGRATLLPPEHLTRGTVAVSRSLRDRRLRAGEVVDADVGAVLVLADEPEIRVHPEGSVEVAHQQLVLDLDDDTGAARIPAGLMLCPQVVARLPEDPGRKIAHPVLRGDEATQVPELEAELLVVLEVDGRDRGDPVLRIERDDPRLLDAL